MLTLTRQGLLLSLSATVIPSQGSSDVPVAVVNDINTYVGYTLEPRVGYYLNGIYKSTVCPYDKNAKTFSVPAEAFKQIGIIDITLALIDNANANHIETCQTVHATVNKAPLGTVVLPDQTTWQDYVNSYMNQLFDSNYKPQFDQIQQDLENLVTEAQQQQQTAEQQQTQIDNAISVMGEYQIVSNDPVQIQFKQGDGTFGPTVDLGDGLASKSMVNGGYYQSIGSQYSGAASDYGIEVEEIVGAYTQETTTGAQKIDVSMVIDGNDTKHTLTDTGLTVTGLWYAECYVDVTPNTDMYLSYAKTGSGVNTVNIFNEEGTTLENKIASLGGTGGTFNTGDNNQVRVLFYSGFGTSASSTYNDVMLCEGTSAKPYEPYTGGAPSPNPDYPQEMQAVEISNLYSSGKNFFNKDDIDEEHSYINTDGTPTDTGVTVTGTYYIAYKVNVPKNTDMYISYEKSGSGANQVSIYKTYPFTPQSYMKLFSNTKGGTFNTGDNNQVRVLFYSGFGTSASSTYNDVMLCEGTSAKPYEPYTGSDTVTLDEPLILRALPNGVCDTWEDGVITRRVGVVEFDGSADEAWTKNSGADYTYQTVISDIEPVAVSDGTEVISDKFIAVSSSVSLANGEFRRGSGNVNNVLVFRYDGLTTDDLDGWKTWLQSNPVTVWYQLATPTTEAFEIETLQSWYPYTNAWCDSVVQPQHITWNVLTGKSSILDGNGNLIQQGYMTPQDNLLINSDFRSGIINQKGQTVYDPVNQWTLSIDRWIYFGQMQVFVQENKLRLYATSNNTGSSYFKQIIYNLRNGNCIAYIHVVSLSGMAKVTLDNGVDIVLNVGDNFVTTEVTDNSKQLQINLDGKGVDLVIDQIKFEYGDNFTGMPPWNYALEYLKCCRYLYVWDLPEIPSHGYNSINNLSYFTGTAFPVPFSSAPTWTVKQLLMDQVDVSSNLNTINVTPNRCTSISLTGQISTISGTIIFSNEPS